MSSYSGVPSIAAAGAPRSGPGRRSSQFNSPSDLQSRYQRLSSRQQQQQQQQSLAPKWSSPPVPEPPLIAPLADLVAWLASLPHISTWPTILIDRLLLAPVSVLLATTRDIIFSPKTHRIVIRLGVLATIFWFALAAAIVSYVGFYRAWVPDVGLRKEVWLQYGYDQPPFAELDFGGHDLDPYDVDSHREYFAQDQAYDITLEIGIPLNQANLDLGNFMVTLDLKTKNNQPIFRVSKPTLLRYNTGPVRAISTLSSMLSRNPPTSQLPSDSQIIRIPLLKRAVLRPTSFVPPLSSLPPDPKADRKVTHGRVSVGRADADKYWMYGGGGGAAAAALTAAASGRSATGGSSSNTFSQLMRAQPHLAFGIASSSRGELQTYGASLRFDAHLTGLRFFMYHYPLLSFLFFTTLFLGFEMATALTLWALAAIYTSSMAVQPASLDTEEHFQEDYDDGEADEDEDETKPRSSRYGAAKSESTSTPTEGSTSYEGVSRYGGAPTGGVTGEDDEDTETETETEARRRRGYARGSGATRIKTEYGVGGEDDGDEDVLLDDPEQVSRLRSLESLRARDASEQAEAIRQARMRDVLEARRMGVGSSSGSGLGGGSGGMEIIDPLAPISPEELSEIQMSRRVLGRLDEETEEETEVGGSVTTEDDDRASSLEGGGGGAGQFDAGETTLTATEHELGASTGTETDPWEDVDVPTTESAAESEASSSSQAAPPQSTDLPQAQAQEKDDEDDMQSTVGGSATSGTRTQRSFGATTIASSTTQQSSN